MEEKMAREKQQKDAERQFFKDSGLGTFEHMYKTHDERKQKEKDLKGGATEQARVIKDKRDRELKENKDRMRREARERKELMEQLKSEEELKK
jgi:hypothetical protein